LKIISWNVNGIRACLNKGLTDFMASSKADFFCLQETKASPDQVESSAIPYSKSVWASAEKKGYSGCATFTNLESCKLSNLLGIPAYDREGRATIAKHPDFTLVNMYFPNGAASEERHHFKMKFLDEILVYFKKLEEKQGPLIICGDYNIAHTEIDIHDPIRNKDSSGFLPEERAWMSKFIENGFIDTFRLIHQGKKDQYTWWSFRQASRARNKGWRIDYICVSESLKSAIKSAKIHPLVQGSDHCPVELELK
jgi:exodeoxyribonuclease-3